MPKPGRGKHPSPILYSFSIALALAAFGALGLWYLLGGRWAWYQGLGAWLLSVNFVAFIYYGFDKAQSRRASRRIPEWVLHGLAIVGGSLGAYAGMRVFHHKTIKGRFRVIFWLIVAAQVVLGVCVMREVWLREEATAPAAAGHSFRGAPHVPHDFPPVPAESELFCLAGSPYQVKWVRRDCLRTPARPAVADPTISWRPLLIEIS
jgi:uncharacterized membrane protein YsdA (DUF1294 family)